MLRISLIIHISPTKRMNCALRQHHIIDPSNILTLRYIHFLCRPVNKLKRTLFTMSAIHRITLFKIDNPEHLDMMLSKYQEMTTTALKDGKPYIKHLYAGKTMDDAMNRHQGYNLAVKMCFTSKEDMEFYDNECKAHADLKAAAKGKVNPPTVIFYPGTVSSEL